MNVLRAAALAAAGLCAGCALWPAPQAPDFPLLPPASLGRSLQFEQTLRAAYGARSFTVQCFASITPERIALSGFTALGQRVFTVEYDGREIRSESLDPGMEVLPPQRLLADLQLALWPLQALQAATAGSAWQISEPARGTRRVRHGDELVAEIHYADPAAADGRLWLVNFPHRYALDVESRPPSP